VSLTSELADPSSPLACYLTARFPHRTAIADAYAAAVGNAPTVAPAAGGGYPWALVGSAFGHRLGFAFAADPPYASLLGATHLTDTEQVAHLAAAQFATAARLAAGQVHRAGYVRVVAGDPCTRPTPPSSRTCSCLPSSPGACRARSRQAARGLTGQPSSHCWRSAGGWPATRSCTAAAAARR